MHSKFHDGLFVNIMFIFMLGYVMHHHTQELLCFQNVIKETNTFTCMNFIKFILVTFQVCGWCALKIFKIQGTGMILVSQAAGGSLKKNII